MMKREQKETAQHTAGPWMIDDDLPPNTRSVIARVGAIPISGNTDGPHISEAELATMPIDRYGTSYPPTDLANAEFIIHACNVHYDLLEACKAALSAIRPEERGEYPSVWEQIRKPVTVKEAASKLIAAIAKAQP